MHPSRRGFESRGDSSDSPLPHAACLHHHTGTKNRLASGARFTRFREHEDLLDAVQ